MVLNVQRDLAAFADDLANIFDRLAADVRKQLLDASSNRGQIWEPVLGFVHAVDWTEPWLILVLLTHITLFFLAVVTRNNINVQMAIFLLGLGSVYYAERVNTILSRHWEKFARQPYFDRHGVFLSTIWSGPLLLVSTLILVNTLRTLVHLIVKWKRADLRYRARLAQQKAD
eukprot:TRINITY_DN26329_c0_g1_i1.p1 TRINITY_DN26329_c0_g1~~TRINITY_DN26329_c0_g1_i1.p1  ORF type:complete len:172 (-),score=22.83 TRINITY_DN26329_c0_g1_i1:405-920(-)